MRSWWNLCSWNCPETCIDTKWGSCEKSTCFDCLTRRFTVAIFCYLRTTRRKVIDVIDASSEVDFARHAMNFTPRSVAMGNSMTKAYKLHVKFESGGTKCKIQRVERNSHPKLQCQCFNRKGDIFLSAWHIRWPAEGKDRSQVSGKIASSKVLTSLSLRFLPLSWCSFAMASCCRVTIIKPCARQESAVAARYWSTG